MGLAALFLASHEPCTLCLSAITWGGYDNFYYLYSHEDSRDAFAIGHDLIMLKELFGLDPGQYARSNAYWQGYWLIDLIEGCEAQAREAFRARVGQIKQRYDALSAIYQQHKHLSEIPLK